jgi:ribonuclease HI
VIEVFIDGAARGQGADRSKTGYAAIGILIYDKKKLVGQFARGLGRRTNNEAEYEALIHAVLLCWAADLPDPIIYSDSQTLVKQVERESRCRSEALVPLLAAVLELREVFRFRLVLVPREYVWEADKAAKECLDGLYKPTPKKNVH